MPISCLSFCKYICYVMRNIFLINRAALGGHAYICQILIKYGVDPNVRDFSGSVYCH